MASFSPSASWRTNLIHDSLRILAPAGCATKNPAARSVPGSTTHKKCVSGYKPVLPHGILAAVIDLYADNFIDLRNFFSQPLFDAHLKRHSAGRATDACSQQPNTYDAAVVQAHEFQ